MTPTYTDYPEFVAALLKEMGTPTLNILHAAVGISGESGELLDAVKKHWAYGKELDITNVIEELGDLEFYMQAMRNLLQLTREEVIAVNMAKLAQRYEGLTYSDEAAIARADKAHQEETFHPTAVEVKVCKVCDARNINADFCYDCGSFLG